MLSHVLQDQHLRRSSCAKLCGQAPQPQGLWRFMAPHVSFAIGMSANSTRHSRKRSRKFRMRGGMMRDRDQIGGMRYSPDHCPNGRRCKRAYGRRYCEYFWQCTEGYEWRRDEEFIDRIRDK